MIIPSFQHRRNGAAEATGGAPRPRVQPVAPPAPAGPAGPRVLIVDDTASVRASLRLLLEEMGLVVVGEAGDGIIGVQAAQSLRPDVILMDWRMPGLDGLEATRRVVRLGLGIQVVMVTAFATRGFEDQARAAGAVTLVAKGEHPSAILDAIERAWRAHPRSAEGARPRALAMPPIPDSPQSSSGTAGGAWGLSGSSTEPGPGWR